MAESPRTTLRSPLVEIVVHGTPAPQGSKTRTKWGVREDNPNTLPWRAAVAAAAAEAMEGRELLQGALRLDVRFYFARPKAHYRANGDLKPAAPVYHVNRPDSDKLLRAVGDSLTGKVATDDCRFAVVHAEKLYGSPRAEIVVRELVT